MLGIKQNNKSKLKKKESWKQQMNLTGFKQQMNPTGFTQHEQAL